MQPPQPPQTDILANVVNGLAQGTVGALIGALATLLAVRVQREKRHIEYSTSRISLLGLTPAAQNTLKVTADKALLTNNPADAGNTVTIHQGYAFEVELKNTGNRRADDVSVNVTLDNSARIANYDRRPVDRPDYLVAHQREPTDPNKLYIKFPYINAKDTVSVTVIGVRDTVPASNNNDPPELTIDVRGKDITVHKKTERTELRLDGAMGAVLVAAALLLTSVLPLSVVIAPLIFVAWLFLRPKV